MRELKKGDKVVMHTCGEAYLEKYEGEIWTCKTDEQLRGDQRIVWLEGFRGCFAVEFLQLVKVKKSILTDDDLEFLKELGTELKTQDNMATRKPLFHQINDFEYEYGFDPNYADDYAILIGYEYEALHTVKEAIEALEDWFEIEGKDLEKLKECTTFHDIEYWCENRGIDCTITGYRKKHRYQNFFLTRKACEKHIQANYYHYRQGKDTICYTDHGWRNPELRRLLEIVEKFAESGEDNE